MILQKLALNTNQSFSLPEHVWLSDPSSEFRGQKYSIYNSLEILCKAIKFRGNRVNMTPLIFVCQPTKNAKALRVRGDLW
jgi:hypothetical protein